MALKYLARLASRRSETYGTVNQHIESDRVVVVSANEESRVVNDRGDREHSKGEEYQGRDGKRALMARSCRRHTVVHDSHLAVNRLGGCRCRWRWGRCESVEVHKNLLWPKMWVVRHMTSMLDEGCLLSCDWSRSPDRDVSAARKWTAPVRFFPRHYSIVYLIVPVDES